MSSNDDRPGQIWPTCVYCDEPVKAGEPSSPINGAADRIHLECAVRAVAGSIGHLRHTCSCFGGDEEEPPGVSVREAARVAYKYYVEHTSVR